LNFARQKPKKLEGSIFKQISNPCMHGSLHRTWECFAIQKAIAVINKGFQS
jgi:hypothetical protein